MENLVFIDTEVGINDRRVHDIGVLRLDGSVFHSGKVEDLVDFIQDTRFVCGHNVIHHDLKYLQVSMGSQLDLKPIDTLYLSPLLFPKRPYHKLLKDDKLQTEELNNPVNDCRKTKDLFDDEVAAFHQLPQQLKYIFYRLLKDVPEFKYFFEYIQFSPVASIRGLLSFFKHDDFGIRDFFRGHICENADIDLLMKSHPVELAYALSLIHVDDSLSIVPPWLLKNFPLLYNVIALLKNRPCEQGCPYCRKKLNAVSALNRYFGYPSYRTYNGEPLQERAVQAAIDGKSLLVVFPTGGGKSITFQIPALMSGENEHGLTVIISPLQSLMKDQVDNLSQAGITTAVTVNGLLSPVERADAFRRVADGSASLLYISPEMLRSKTVEKMLLFRNVVRFVIDEAHCFSSWGHDFRIDYLYIGDFIKKLQERKGNGQRIAISCFTATAKQKVISDICEYFKKKLDLDLDIYASDAARENLTYTVLYEESDEEKYQELRNLIERKSCPCIVYVSRTKRAVELARKLTEDGYPARPYHGRMDSKDKIENQEAFIRNDISIIVATSAFGMGVDKKDIKLVIHYDISDSLENYIQESGRAGRDTSLQAECYVLYNDSDLDKHFILLNQTKLSISDIQQVWQAIKRMTGTRKRICCSPLEIARMAGWDSSVPDIETRVKTAIAALENAGYIHRGNNMPRVYATGILPKNMEEAVHRINEATTLFPEEQQRENAKRIIKSLISSRSIARAGNDDAESRVDYLADMLGIPKAEVIRLVNLMREGGLLADTMDMSAYILKEDTHRRSNMQLERFARLENFVLSQLEEDCATDLNLKELNALAEKQDIPQANVKNIRTILYFLTVKHYIQKEEFKGISGVRVVPLYSRKEMLDKYQRRVRISRFIIEELFDAAQHTSYFDNRGSSDSKKEQQVAFSLVGMYNKYRSQNIDEGVTQTDVQDALLYLSNIGALRLEGGFLVLYNGMEIHRLEMDNRIRYKREDYASLDEYYTQKIQQVHIVGEFANMMVKDYNAALQFVNDYFQMDFRKFISKYFKDGRAEKLNQNMTAQRYQKLFGCLSEQQKAIIDDDESKHIVVVAGPGSGKTRVLVHKLAAMLTLEDVKHEQLLMVTFSRAAATEFKMRLCDLIGNAAHFVEIKTFHSYCFDLMGKIGSLDASADVVKAAAQMIRDGEVEPERISKRVLVVDEAQDMDQDEFDLIQALMAVNDDMRVIAVGDDDQNIYEFRGSDSKYMRSLVTDYDARMYELVENYRSKEQIVKFSNAFVKSLSSRMKNRDIVSAAQGEGRVSLVRYAVRNMEHSITEDLRAHQNSGSACVMTATNEEASRILGLLLKKGIHAKLIQSNEGFSLHNLTEVRYFMKKLLEGPAQSGETSRRNHTEIKRAPSIKKENWQYAKEKLVQAYGDSTCLENCLNMIETFEKLNSRMFWSDFEEFIYESEFEDFYPEKKGAVYVSTIHKSKGREFDQVYLMLVNVQAQTNEEIRRLYVAMTRARSELSIHYFNTPIIHRMSQFYTSKTEDTTLYQAPEEIVLQLTHKDVFLDFFKERKRDVFQLHSGNPLLLRSGYLDAMIQGQTKTVVRLSRHCMGKLEMLSQKGYVPSRAEVRFVVAWKGENDSTETAVLLPNIYLKRD